MDARAALLEGLVDYAGLFPPASLDLPTALRLDAIRAAQAGLMADMNALADALYGRA